MIPLIFDAVKTIRKDLKKKGVLLVNLGSPDSASVSDVKKYLDEFLMDERVIDMPYWKRFMLVKGIILNTRPKHSAAAYKKIWREDGSPLIVFSEKFRSKLQQRTDLPVALGMRYGSLSVKEALTELADKKVKQVFLIPLYPHYAMSSYETVVEKVKTVQQMLFPEMEIDIQPPFYADSEYIKALSKAISSYMNEDDFDQILFSYHGIPERHIYKSDPTGGHCKIDSQCCITPSEAHQTCYRHQCFETTKKVVEQLHLPKSKYGISFQSRLLKDPWLKPYTDLTLSELPAKGIKKLAVVAPAFVTDCLETLEEIAMEGKRTFLEAGGEKFTYIPCLNYDDEWVNTVNKWIETWRKKA